MKNLIFFVLTFLIVTIASAQVVKVDILIKNANLFDSRKGTVSANKTILIKDGLIVAVTGPKKTCTAAKIIDAKGKLVTPGFIDTHVHLTDVYRSYGPLPEYLSKDSLELYRKRFSDTYLPYGITAVMIMGQSEKWILPVLGWHADPRAGYVDVNTVGGALVSNEGRKPYINHAIVNNPSDAKQKVIAFYKMGIRHIKLYWKLRRPEFEAAYKTADSLGMKVYGHVDQDIMHIDTAFDIGLRNFEHILTLVNSVLYSKNDVEEFNLEMKKNYPTGSANRQLERLEMFRFMHDKRPEAIPALINKLSKDNTTFSTSIHLMAEPFGLTYFNINSDSSLSPTQLARCKDNFKIFMGYVKMISDKGIKIRIGTDWPNGGKAFISEQILLSEYGFTIPQILQISTINGANALGLQDQYGSIEKGRKADLLIWNFSPFDGYQNFNSDKTIIKDGQIFKN